MMMLPNTDRFTSSALRRLNFENAGFRENSAAEADTVARVRAPAVKRYGTRPRPNGDSRRGGPATKTDE